ncbi:unnamed protein product, partial [Symbiodinium pilosum]
EEAVPGEMEEEEKVASLKDQGASSEDGGKDLQREEVGPGEMEEEVASLKDQDASSEDGDEDKQKEEAVPAEMEEEEGASWKDQEAALQDGDKGPRREESRPGEMEEEVASLKDQGASSEDGDKDKQKEEAVPAEMEEEEVASLKDQVAASDDGDQKDQEVASGNGDEGTPREESDPGVSDTELASVKDQEAASDEGDRDEQPEVDRRGEASKGLVSDKVLQTSSEDSDSDEPRAKSALAAAGDKRPMAPPKSIASDPSSDEEVHCAVNQSGLQRFLLDNLPQRSRCQAARSAGLRQDVRTARTVMIERMVHVGSKPAAVHAHARLDRSGSNVHLLRLNATVTPVCQRLCARMKGTSAVKSRGLQ